MSSLNVFNNLYIIYRIEKLSQGDVFHIPAYSKIFLNGPARVDFCSHDCFKDPFSITGTIFSTNSFIYILLGWILFDIFS